MPSPDVETLLDRLLGPSGARSECRPSGSESKFQIVEPADEAAAAFVVRGLAGAGTCVRTTPQAPGIACPAPVFLRYPPPREPELDTVSGLVRVDAGLGLDELERFLVGKGRSLGGLGWGLPAVPVGAWLEEGGRGLPWPRAAGLAARVLRFRAVLANGTEVSDGRAPRSAAGPDLRPLWIGARGGFGMLLSATLSVYVLPATVEAWTLTGDPASLARIARDFAPHLPTGDTLLVLAGGIWEDSPALLHVTGGPDLLVDARRAFLERLAGRAARKLGGDDLAALRSTLEQAVRTWTLDDPCLGPWPGTEERSLEPGAAARWLAETRGRGIAAVESARAFRCLSGPGGLEPPRARPARGPLARLAKSLDPAGRWNP